MSDLLLTARARQIIAQTATAFYCDADDVYSVRREADLVTARHVAMYVLQAGFGLSTTRIGRLLHRDHATVIYGIRRVKASPELLGAGTAAASQASSEST